MSLGAHLPDDARTIDRSSANTAFWLTGLLLFGALVVFLLLQRLGLPTDIVVSAISIMAVCVMLCLAWVSRTMTSLMFFYANRSLGPFTSGMGSTTDFLSGAVLIFFFSNALPAKMALATAIILGVFLQATLFAAPFQRAGVSSLPGFLAWRGGSQITGYLALATTTIMLLSLALAEFQIAREILPLITGISLERSGWVVLILALLPCVIGGWAGLLLVNAALVIWMLICLIVPAVATGFLSGILSQITQQEIAGAPVGVLGLAPSDLLFGSASDISFLSMTLTIIVLAAGFSVLPSALSRLSTNNRSIDAIESVGWLALMAFLILSALPLSIGLIIDKPTSVQLAQSLQNQPVLQMLPFFAIVFAALNALAATLFAASSSVVRAAKRMRNLDPGEQSVFSTRLTIVLLALVLLVLPREWIPTIDGLVVAALALGAGGLFVPLVVGTWMTLVSTWALNLSIAAGTIATALLLVDQTNVLALPPVTAGAVGAACAFIVLLADRIVILAVRRPVTVSSSAQFLRHHH